MLSLGSCSYWFVREVLIHHGIDPDKDLTIIGLGQLYPSVLDLIRRGELDGAVISEPTVTIGEHAKLFRVWHGINDVTYVPRIQWCVCVANNDIVANEPNLIEAVIRACHRSYRYAAQNPDEWSAFARAISISSEGLWSVRSLLSSTHSILIAEWTWRGCRRLSRFNRSWVRSCGL